MPYGGLVMAQKRDLKYLLSYICSQPSEIFIRALLDHISQPVFCLLFLRQPAVYLFALRVALFFSKF